MSPCPEENLHVTCARRHSARPRRRLVALALSFATALTVGSALAVPTLAHAEVSVPSADVLNVDFRNGSPADRAANRTVVTYGTPKVATNDTVKKVAAGFDGKAAAYVYDMANVWNPLNTPNITAGATIECWFSPVGSMPSGEHESCSGIETGGYAIQVNGTKVKASFYIGGAYRTLTYSKDLTLKTWYHVMATYDGAAMVLYINGAEVSRLAITGVVGAPGGRYFVLGADTDASGNPEKFAQSQIAVSRIWSSALTADQVAAVYASDTAAPASVPAADVLDIDLAGGSFTDKASGITPDPYADPQIATDVALGRRLPASTASARRLSTRSRTPGTPPRPPM